VGNHCFLHGRPPSHLKASLVVTVYCIRRRIVVSSLDVSALVPVVSSAVGYVP
jgi:hypothetical protein